ncbi:MAG: DNA mismatch repair endonuclease MutL [Bacilli bacterium]|nr:DNA mismatch repair endonuclease MutL [Bacilli bacterium]
MPKIKVMSDNLANKIAAGEVVEKCASVVKELVENSIDAGATSIKIELKDGGLSEIKIIDDGNGMEKEDASLCFQRHATSKLIREDDLFFINTLGFRGEALPSIASVSEVDMITCASNVGTHIHIKGGKLEVEEPADARKGTIITINNLFFNTPARLKYLKSEQYELSNSVSFIEKLSFSYPNIKFELTNNGKTIIKTSGSNNLLKTIHEIYGLNVSSNMLEVKGSTDDYDMTGYICKPEILKSNRNHMITIVNGRIVKNNDLNRAINDAYYTYKPDIKFPIVVLKFETDPTLIDVNIHPTKQDIKLSKVNELYNMIVDTIKNKLYQELLIPKALKDDDLEISLPSTMIKNEIVETKIEEEKEEYISKNNFQTELDFSDQKEEQTNEDIKETIINPELKKLVLYPVGLALGTYIIAQNEEGVYMIDQHAAQERINYDKYLKALKEKEITTITPLFPINIELNSSDFITIKDNMNVLEEMGFVIEEFGLNTYAIKEHPTWLLEGYEEESIHKIFDSIINLGSRFDRVKFNEHIAITLACKMSIKANTRISTEAQEEILKELVETDNPYNCPHGRPTIIKFSIYDMEKMFKRAMN